MHIPETVRWDLSPEEAQATQLQLSKQVVTGDEFGPVRLIAGVDNSYEVERGLTYAGVVVLTLCATIAFDSRRIWDSRAVVRQP